MRPKTAKPTQSPNYAKPVAQSPRVANQASSPRPQIQSQRNQIQSPRAAKAKETDAFKTMQSPTRGSMIAAKSPEKIKGGSLSKAPKMPQKKEVEA